jgi:hypothetical protein
MKSDEAFIWRNPTMGGRFSLSFWFEFIEAHSKE